MNKIVIIDDDQRLCEKLKKYLSDFQFDLSTFNHPKLGIEAIKDNDFEVVILDGMLPDIDGFEVCKQIRSFSQIPIIFLTGRIEEADKILGLEYGADDYITKPFSPRELVARLKSQLRRAQHLTQSEQSLKSEELVLNIGSYIASLNNQEVKLTATEFEILKFLMENQGVVKSREEIMEGLHGDTWEAFDRSLDIAVSRIRKKLKEIDSTKEYIKTVRLKGYIFVSSN